jgi:hypothetical protein
MSLTRRSACVEGGSIVVIDVSTALPIGCVPAIAVAAVPTEIHRVRLDAVRQRKRNAISRYNEKEHPASVYDKSWRY